MTITRWSHTNQNVIFRRFLWQFARPFCQTLCQSLSQTLRAPRPKRRMAKQVTDGLARLQNESRIPTSTWRQWCELLKMDPMDAIDVWEELCHPIMVATGKVPEVPYILQLRTARPNLDIFEFKEEAGKVLHFITFLYNLDDETLTKGKVKSSLLKFYRQVAIKVGDDVHHMVFTHRFLIDACAIVLVSKVLKGPNISLSGVLKPVVEGRGSLGQIVRLGLKSLGKTHYADAVKECLNKQYLGFDDGPTAAEMSDGDDALELQATDDEFGSLNRDAAAASVATDEPFEDNDAEAEDDDDDYEDEEEEDYEYDDDDCEDEEEHDGDDDESITDFLIKFKTAMHAVYEFDIAGEHESLDETTAGRLQTIAAFEPLLANIPSMEEAQSMARRAEVARNPTKVPKATATRTSPAAGGGVATSAGSAGGASAATGGRVSARGKTGRKTAAIAAAARRPGPRKDGVGEERVDMDEVEGVEVDPADEVEVAAVSFGEFSERARQVSSQLANVEKSDQVIWTLFLDPGAEVQDLATLARTVSKENTQSYRAYAIIRTAAQFMELKNLVEPDRVLKRERNFMLEVSQLFNFVNNSTKELRPTGQMATLVKVLDHAAGALLRLEAVRANAKFASIHKEEYTRDSVTIYYEGAMRSVTDLTDRDELARARERADHDTVKMLLLFEAQQFVDRMKATISEYVEGLIAEDLTNNVTALKTEFAANPIRFDGGERSGETAPPELVKQSDLGETFDEAARYICDEAWSVMQPVHNPEAVIADILAALRQQLAGSATFQPVRRRHQERPGLALAVVSLDKISGNANLKDLFVRASEDGQILFVEEYEDGSFVDLLELREYKPVRLVAAAKKQAEQEDMEQLVSGRKYLYTVGRTSQLFGDMPADIVNSCLRDEEGGSKLFPAF